VFHCIPQTRKVTFIYEIYRSAYMGNSFSSERSKSEGKPIATTTSQLVWANYDLVHEIMDFLQLFKEIGSIPLICRATSDSLFSYRFKNREYQECDWISFLGRARVYDELIISRKYRTWYGRKLAVPTPVRSSNYSRLINMKFYSLNTNLEYMDESHINVLSGCSMLTFKSFRPSQLNRICKLNVPFLAHTLVLKPGLGDYDIKFSVNSLSPKTVLFNVKRIVIDGNGLERSHIFVEISIMLSRLPSLVSLDLSECCIPPKLMLLLPVSLTKLVITINMYYPGNEGIDLTYLTELRKLQIRGWYPHTQLMILPAKLEELFMPDTMWSHNQLIPDSVKSFRSRFRLDDHAQIANMRNSIENSNIENLIMFDYISWWWNSFQISPNIRNIQCSYMGVIRIVKELNPLSNNKLTHLLYSPGNRWIDNTLIICGKDINEVPTNMVKENIEFLYHIPLEHIHLDKSDIILPIPWTRCEEMIYRL
jgi:hypothetical protein